ncbi:MAG: VWA domain-containing protein, partial [Myxococcota bacterium]
LALGEARGQGEPQEGAAQGNEEENSGDEEGPQLDLNTPEMMDRAMESMAEMSALEESLGAMMPNMGWGLASGHLQRAMTDDLTRLVELMRRLPQLRAIADMLGRLEEEVRRQRSAHRGGRESVVGVHFGRDLATVLPGELALLGEQATEDLFYQRYTEHRLLSLELDGTTEGDVSEGERRGPVVACVDTSGSMSGWRETMAKALILAVVRMALPQNRPVRLMLFGGPGDFRDIDIFRGPAGAKALLDFLAMSFHAGTDYDGPLARAMELLDTDAYERADILIVTDGYCQAGRDTIDRVQRARAERGFRVVSVITEGHAHGVAPFSDHVWMLERDENDGVDLSTWDPDEMHSIFTG